jgi:hypothetical protein
MALSGTILRTTAMPRGKAHRWCSQVDIVTTFRIVGHEIRRRLHDASQAGITAAEAHELAGRIKEQRDLVHQIAGPRNAKHVRRLLRLNRSFQRRLVALAERCSIDPRMFHFR